MVKLRKLKKKDAAYMLEWMQDAEIQEYFPRNMGAITLAEAERFCERAKDTAKLEDSEDIHYAIVDESDEYIGTISLKKINFSHKTAEYAISIRRKAHGQGIAKEATNLLLEKGFNEVGLHRIYLNVLSTNRQAIRFYEKYGFTYEGEFKDHLFLRGKYISLKWYAMLKDEFTTVKFTGRV